jgi:hypothetical protein
MMAGGCSRWAGGRALVAIEEGVGQETHQAVYPVGVFLLALVTMLLDLGVVG